jgi:cytochrome c biogenesis protein CcmG, thiol:disulfide interchange protein DsbE
MELARRNEIPIYGLNYKDQRQDAIAWLGRYGDPYLASAFDHNGRVGIDWGVYGVPETFVVDSQGIIRYKHIGPLTEQAWREKVRPIIDQIKARQG